MAKFLITAVAGSDRFKGFYVKDEDLLHVAGVIDPFLDYDFGGGGVTEWDVVDFPEGTEQYSPEWQKKLLEWAEGVVGKYIICDHLVYKAFATAGNTRFSDE